MNEKDIQNEDNLETDVGSENEDMNTSTDSTNLEEEQNITNKDKKKSKKGKKKDQEEELAEVREKNKELEEALIREKAEVENFKKRMKQEFDTNLKFSNQTFIEKMLPVLDSFDRALAGTDNASPEVQNFVKGVEMIQSLFKEILQNEGLEVIETVDQQFDPYVHQAVLTENVEDKDNNIILEELQKGYKLKDRVLRASMVKVNQK